MKDWTTIELTPLSPRDRSRYAAMIHRAAASRFDPVIAIYQRYKALPADVAAHSLHLDMQTPGWNRPPQTLINQVAAELFYVRQFFCFAAEPKQPGIDADEYVDETNREEVYAALCAFIRADDMKKQAEAAAEFCRGTQAGGLR